MTACATQATNPAGEKRSILARIGIGLLRVYQAWSSTRPPHCRYDPSCSHYAVDALSVHGFFKGIWLALRRIGRCHPWGGMGYDPVPAKSETDRAPR
jgi:putative membrane protein insertion efficiency factor